MDVDYTPTAETADPARHLMARLGGIAMGGLVTLDTAAEVMRVPRRLAYR